MLVACSDAEAHSDLAVAHLAQGSGVLPLNTNGMRALFGESGVVDDPGLHLLLPKHLRQCVTGRFTPNDLIIPRRIRREVVQPLMFGVHPLRICAGPGGDRLDALPLALTENTERIRSKTRSSLRSLE